MVKRIGGFRRNTRHKLSKEIRQKGKISLTKYFRTFSPGDRISLKVDSTVQKGACFPRFHGKTGIVKARRGRCYEVLLKEGKVEKCVIVHPIHIVGEAK
ncbi:MAG: 50S ribosomal protein L21e [archaeon]